MSDDQSQQAADPKPAETQTTPDLTPSQTASTPDQIDPMLTSNPTKWGLRYRACMVLGAVGDCLAYRNGDWEFQRDGARIHAELNQLGGLKQLTPQGLLVSDDTVMHMATAKGLIDSKDAEEDLSKVFLAIAKEYVTCMEDMSGRAPGITCIRGARALRPSQPKGWIIPFDKAGGGCGGAMRSMCIGLRYWKPEDEDKLIAVAIESGRMTHNHPTGYLGSLVSALFTAYAIRGDDNTPEIPPKKWGNMLMKVLPRALKYVKDQDPHDGDLAENNWNYFYEAWTKYLQTRKIEDGESEPDFPEPYDVKERDDFYKSVSWDGWGGSSGHDAPMIAYDALLGCKGSWLELANRAMFHGGDSDSTGIIAACWFGAMHGFEKSAEYKANWENIEKLRELVDYADELLKISGREKS